jgi:DNA polymerase-3 subunit epsilon
MTLALCDLPVLVLDCQTTGGNPRTGDLLEVGWMEVRAAARAPAPAGPRTFLLRLPPGGTIPPAVQKLTGIDDLKLKSAVDPGEAWEQLVDAARGVAALSGHRPCPAVIHFARFEIPFLRAWHEKHACGDAFFLDIVCTHELAARLLPDLPRKGLRAVAGFLGHSVPPEKRCGPHAEATAVIWRHLVECLARDARVTTWDQLQFWLSNAPLPARGRRVYPMPARVRETLPDRPGVYRMVRSNGDLLYVGKARSLKGRVNSYFQARRHSEKILEMLSQAVGLDFRETPTALEAALLESQMIKQDRPPYNTALTSNNRTLAFVSSDFSRQAPHPDKACRLGPVPAGSLYAGLHLLGACLETGGQTWAGLDGARMLAVPAGNEPDADCLRHGLTLFRAKYADLFGHRPIWQALRHIGRRCWVEKQLQRETTDEQDDSGASTEEDAASDSATFSWTPLAVVAALEARLRHGGFLLRRANWLAMLSESSVTWQAACSGQNHVLVLRNGQITPHVSASGGNPPVPPGWEESFSARRPNLDLQVYDRLRVLTTELRRLLAEKRAVAVRLNPEVILREGKLERLLRWV